MAMNRSITSKCWTFKKTEKNICKLSRVVCQAVLLSGQSTPSSEKCHPTTV